MKNIIEIKKMKIEGSELLSKKCKPCEGGVPPFTPEEIENYMNGIDKDWKVTDGKQISRHFSFINFRHAMDFADMVGELAEEEGHHPDMHIHYGKVEVELSTHAIGGLSENDFIMAAKIDALIQTDN